MSDAYRAKVRMYRHGLGDCFLISLPRAGAPAPYRIVIDCGVIVGTPDAEAKMRAVVEDIAAGTQGPDGRGKIDLVIGTHEHWDHLSGFVQAADALAKIDFAEVWLAWTEDPNDPQARRLKAQRGNALQALQLSESRLRLSGRDDAADQVGDFLTSFFGIASGSSTSAALEVVRGLAGKPPRYCSPSDMPVQPDGTSVQLFVLGPPRDEQLLQKSEVAATSPEVYGLMEQVYGVDASIVDVPHLKAALDSVDPDAPFDPMQTIPFPVAQQMPFFAQRYWGSVTDPAGDGPDWRRVDSAFLEAAPALALQLDSATNNTSLVLAIRLDGGDVLLFPADAQVGNWLSWQNLSWKSGDNVIATGPDLLKRVVFYKVGHHGSHNATLKAHGLEMMNALKLAMIPVNVKMAQAKNWNRMPLKELVEALNAKTNGAVVQADSPLPAGIGAVETSPDGQLWYEVTL
jgi:hypothetical protein